MKHKNVREWDPKPYIKFVSDSRSEEAAINCGEKRGEMIRKSLYKSMFGTYLEMKHNKVDDLDIYLWLRLWYENIDEFDRYSNIDLQTDSNDYLGAKAYAKAIRNDFESVKKHLESARRKATESNRKSELKKAVDNAELFIAVKPDFYSVERHGKWLGKSEFDSMMNYCKEIVAQYAAVSTTLNAA